MRILFSMIVFCVVLNASFAQSDYFPVDKGTEWTYAFGAEIYAGTPYEDYISEVKILDVSETIDGKEYFVSETSMGSADGDKTVIQSYFRFGDDGSLRTKVDKNSKELVSLNKTPKIGDTHASQQGGTSKVVDLNASIKTPLKTYNNCLVVEINENQTITRAYYQKDLGMVATTMLIEGSEKIFMYMVGV